MTFDGFMLGLRRAVGLFFIIEGLVVLYLFLRGLLPGGHDLRIPALSLAQGLIGGSLLFTKGWDAVRAALPFSLIATILLLWWWKTLPAKGLSPHAVEINDDIFIVLSFTHTAAMLSIVALVKLDPGGR